MKKLGIFLIVAVTVFSVSCEKIEDITVGIETAIDADIPVVSQKLKSSGSEPATYGFAGGGLFTLSDAQEIRKYIDNIQDIIALDGSLIQFKNANEGNKIMTIHMKYGIQTTPGVEPQLVSGFSFSGQLSAKDGVINYENDSWPPILIKALMENKDAIFVIKLEGTANYSVNTSVKINVPVKVNTTPLQ